MTKTAKKTKLTPDAWVIEWPEGEEITKSEAYAEFGRKCSAKVRQLYRGWDAAAICPMGGK